MTRLMIMTFHGRSRLSDDEQHHVHEVSPVMWVPLVILAVLSVVGGWINVPHAIADTPLGLIPHSEWLHEWLHPVTAGAEDVFARQGIAAHENAPFGGGEALWAALSFAIATAVIIIAATMLNKRKYAPAVESAPDRGFARVLYRKWYVDEIYDLLVVKPLVGASKFAWLVIDAAIIDGLFVNGSGYASKAVGWMGSRLQTGSLSTYALALVVGVVTIVLVVVL
jgi:NADH-quinone oxidoreductase subunit L